jgi:rSAM/selenodomain-associated transferase 1
MDALPVQGRVVAAQLQPADLTPDSIKFYKFKYSAMTSVLIIFVKNPVLGKVKTRLAHALGEENALMIYQKLLQHTCSVTTNVPADKYVFYLEYINHNDIWKNEVYKKELQYGNDLGKRMKNAFEILFQRGYKEIVIIGSDCYELTEEIIMNAFDQLKQKDVVIGPAKDGGYYLLGMNVFIPQLFTGKSWSTNKVFRETLTEIKSFNYSIYQLPVLNDIDTSEDVSFTY